MSGIPKRFFYNFGAMKRLFFFFLLGVVLVPAKAGLLQGVVFEDLNRNGLRDSNEKPLSAIPVSNGCEVVLTDKKGCFQLPVNSGEAVFAIPPSSFVRSDVVSKVKNSGFYTVADSLPLTCTIPLIREVNPSSFRLALIGDVQVDDEQQLAYTQATFMQDRLNGKKADLYLMMGDLVNEKPELQLPVRSMLEQLEAPVWTVYGNHDRNLKYGNAQKDWFTRQLGMTDYAFNRGNVHFIILNNVQPKGKMGYEGGLTDRQLEFVSNDLKQIKSGQHVVVAMHIPLDETKRGEELVRLLEPFSCITFLTAHLHTTGRLIHTDSKGRSFQEILSGAVCGSWWTGERDDRQIPSGMMQCGSPRNYYLADFSGSTIAVTFKGVNQDVSRQMNLWIQGTDSLDKNVPALAVLPSGTVRANIFAASDSSEVTIQLDDQQPVRMQKINAAAPEVIRNVTLSKADVYPTAHSRRAALRTQECPHLWEYCFDKRPEAGVHKLVVRASDRFGWSVVETFTWFVK